MLLWQLERSFCFSRSPKRSIEGNENKDDFLIEKRECTLKHLSQEDLITSSTTLWELHQVVGRIPNMKPQNSRGDPVQICLGDSAFW